MFEERLKKRECNICRGLLFLFFLFFVFLANLRPADLNLKCMGGLSHSSLNREGISGINRITFGLGLDLWIVKNFGLEIDTLYARKGYQNSYENSDVTFTEISIPLLIKTRIVFKGNARYAFSILGGLEYSHILTEMDPNYRQHDIGIVVGGNLERRFEKFAFFIESRYEWGLLDQSDEYLPSRFEFKTRTLFLMAGIKIKL